MCTDSLYVSVQPGGHDGPGEFVVIPSFPGCRCEYMCVAKDDYESERGCVCPPNWVLKEDGLTCIGMYVCNKNSGESSPLVAYSLLHSATHID